MRAVDTNVLGRLITRDEPKQAAVAQFRQPPSVGFSDCLMAEVARKAGHAPLGTFDRDLGKVDGAHRL